MWNTFLTDKYLIKIATNNPGAERQVYLLDTIGWQGEYRFRSKVEGAGCN